MNQPSETSPFILCCSCGAKFSARPQSLGKKVKCPMCGEGVVASAPPAHASGQDNKTLYGNCQAVGICLVVGLFIAGATAFGASFGVKFNEILMGMAILLAIVALGYSLLDS